MKALVLCQLGCGDELLLFAISLTISVHGVLLAGRTDACIWEGRE